MFVKKPNHSSEQSGLEVALLLAYKDCTSVPKFETAILWIDALSFVEKFFLKSRPCFEKSHSGSSKKVYYLITSR